MRFDVKLYLNQTTSPLPVIKFCHGNCRVLVFELELCTSADTVNDNIIPDEVQFPRPVIIKKCPSTAVKRGPRTKRSPTVE